MRGNRGAGWLGTDDLDLDATRRGAHAAGEVLRDCWTSSVNGTSDRILDLTVVSECLRDPFRIEGPQGIKILSQALWLRAASTSSVMLPQRTVDTAQRTRTRTRTRRAGVPVGPARQPRSLSGIFRGPRRRPGQLTGCHQSRLVLRPSLLLRVDQSPRLTRKPCFADDRILPPARLSARLIGRREC